ncbi:MAG: hypothetical protein LUD43_06600, partial [Firmicutes bacterium]|nr:hypothetical protein [Bacillota bacterium]
LTAEKKMIPYPFSYIFHFIALRCSFWLYYTLQFASCQAFFEKNPAKIRHFAQRIKNFRERLFLLCRHIGA